MRLLYNDKSIHLPTDQPLILGRNKTLEITDQRISRRQVSIYYDLQSEQFQVSVLVPHANVKLNGSLLAFQEPVNLNDQDTLCLHNDSYCMKFSSDSECTTDQMDDQLSDESSDIYDFETSKCIIKH